MWSNFELISVEDETLNSAFCSNGLFRISSEKLVERNPRVTGILQNRRLIISIDKTLVLFQDENRCNDGNFLDLSCDIEGVATSESGDLIVCALSNGMISGFHVRGFNLFNLSTHPDDYNTGRTFAEIRYMNGSYFVQCSRGPVYQIIIDEVKVNESLKQLDTSNMDNTLNFDDCIVIDRVFEKHLREIITSFVPMVSYNLENNVAYTSVMSTSNESVYFQRSNSFSKVLLKPEYSGMKKVFNLFGCYVALTHNGQLVEICSTVKLTSELCVAYKIDDFIIMECTEDTVELLILTKPNESGIRLMKIVDFPSLECKYELDINEYVWLVQQPKSAVNIYYITGVAGNNQHVQEIEMKILSETQPSLRLDKLIRTGRLDEAEDFAKQFDLSLQLIYQAKTRRLLGQLATSRHAAIETLQQTFDKMMEILNMVKDPSFFLTIRLVAIPERNMKKVFLQFLLDKINKNCTEAAEINEHLLRLDTLRLIDPYEVDSEWQNFVYHHNLTKHCIELFKTDMPAACLIWSRHISSIILNMDALKIASLLKSIPEGTPPLQLIQWLMHFVPPILQHLPQMMRMLVTFVIGKTKALQFSPFWPKVGLTFINDVIVIFKDVKFPIMDMRLQYETNMEEMEHLSDALKDLTLLKEKFNLTTNVENYLQETKEHTAFRLLQTVQLLNLKRVVTEFLYPMFVGQEIRLQSSITQYIQFLVSNQNISYWEKRCVILVGVIHNEDTKLNVILDILKSSPAPWSPTITPLIKYANSDHPTAAKILLEQRTQVVKIIKVKYGWPAKSQGCLRMLANRVLKMREPSMLNDIKELTESAPEIAHAVDMNVMIRLAEYEEFVGAIRYIDGLAEQRKQNCCRSVVEILMQILDSISCYDSLSENYIELLQLLKTRCAPASQSEIQDTLNIVNLRREFQLEAHREQLVNDNDRQKLLQDGIQYLLLKIKNDRNQFIPALLGGMKRLTNALSFDYLTGIYQTLKLIDNVHVSCAVLSRVAEIIDSDRNTHENLQRLVAMLLTQQMKYFEESSSSWELDPLTYPLADRLLRACYNDSTFSGMAKLELLRWVQLGTQYYDVDVLKEYSKRITIPQKIFAKICATESCKDVSVRKSYKRDSLSTFDMVHSNDIAMEVSNNLDDQEMIIKCIGQGLRVVVSSMKADQLEPPHTYVRASLTSIDPETAKMDFRAGLETLVKHKKYPAAVTLVHLVLSYQNYTDVIIPADFAENLKRKSLKYFLSQKEPDYNMAVFVLFLCNHRDKCLEYLRVNMLNESQRAAFHTLLEFYYINIGEMERAVEERGNRMRFRFFFELCKLDPSLKAKKTLSFHNIVDLTKEMKSKVLSVELLRKMSENFSWDYQQVLVSQIITIFNLQELEFEVSQDNFGKEMIVIKSSMDSILCQCQPYISEITNYVLLSTRLTKYLEEMNFYFYEMYLCILEIFSNINHLQEEMIIWKNILIYLMDGLTMKRTHRAGQIELDAWLKLQPDGGMLPKIAKYRLPFLLLIRHPLKALLKEEITIENYKKILVLVELKARLENMDPQELQDYFCKSAVINSISEYKIQAEELAPTTGWHLQPVNNAFLQAILRVVDCVSDLSSKLFILYYVTNNAPEGADQVEAAYECYKFACEHEHDLASNVDAKDKMEKIIRKYPIFKTQHLLLQYGISDDKLLALVKNPRELINALYSETLQHKVDINTLVCEISKLHQIDIDAIQVTLIQKWLSIFGSSNDSSENMEETLYEDHNMSVDNSDAATSADEYVARAHYILKSWNKEKSVQFLITQLCTGDTNLDAKKQLQIYDCFSKLIDDQCIPYIDVFNPGHYIVLKCIYYLKSLGFNNLTVSKFEETEKMGLLKRLWQSHATNSKGLEVIAYICLGYNIFLPQIWNGVLKQMSRTNMISHLTMLLDIVSAREQLVTLEGYRMAWETIIKAPFRNASRIRSFEEDAVLAKSLILLQRCPVSASLNLMDIAEVCINANRVCMAAVLVPYANETLQPALKKLIFNNMETTLRQQILELEEFGIASIVTRAVFSALNLNKSV
ncbi:kinetochore-associated protein 1 [Topomyia yanbarensis]|uniref:kinetochore-associated protein 1 n=1 Tax=Topomyia yanbarensis TaxID=2498891 RepID=UPI00273BE5ED|nr:kinetochore-associated protein 1 [Topomyia yanbarensis]